MVTEKSSGAVVFIEGGLRRYLLLNYGKGYWGFAKGIVEKGESERDAAKREIEEETGIHNYLFIKGFREEVSYSFRRKGEIVHKVVVYFLARANDSRVTLSQEHIGYSWLPYEEAEQNLTYKNTKKLLNEAEEFLEKSTTARVNHRP